jgi:glycine/D-amino acid oxidase-like deaminating enzyme
MDLRSGYPLWLVKSGLPFGYPKLEKNIKTDVVVLGGGISGALTAHYLSKHNIKCVVVDGRTIGLGSTCASTALLQYQIDESMSSLAEKIGKKEAVRAYRLCANAVDELQRVCTRVGYDGFERKKTLFFASYKRDAAFVQREYEMHLDAGFDVEYLSQRDIKKMFGFPAPNALYSNHSAHIDAYLLTHALLQYNLRRGQEVYDRTNVADIRHHRKGVTLATQEGFTIKCNKMVYATGYEAVQYIRKKIVNLSSTYAIASEHSDMKENWYEDCLIWETKNPYLYLRTTGDRRIIVGGRDEPYYSPAKRDAKTKQKSKQLREDFGKLFPHTAFNTEFSWTGTFGSTKDGLPYIGEYKELPNALFALGFGGNGITFSVIAAKIIADLLRGKANRDSNLFSFNR